VVAAASASAALAECESRQLLPDFVLSDYKLGETDTGTAAIALLRGRFGPLPAAIVSGEALSASDLPPGVPLLAKPLRPERLEKLLAPD
jgi:CheY-like chemotaxis protein